MTEVKLKPKQSRLDYLWENLGGRIVSTDSKDLDSNSIPSYGLILELLKELCTKVVGSVTQDGNTIIVKSADGFTLNIIDIETLGSEIQSFGKRLITENDKNSPYPVNSYVYYLKLNDGREYTAPVHQVGSTNTISNTILDNTIYSDLKISSKVDGVIFSKEQDGLSGSVYLEGSTHGIRFAILTEDEYLSKVKKDSTTLYFIKDKPYMYFGKQKLGGSSDISEFESRLTTIENLINWEEYD